MYKVVAHTRANTQQSNVSVATIINNIDIHIILKKPMQKSCNIPCNCAAEAELCVTEMCSGRFERLTRYSTVELLPVWDQLLSPLANHLRPLV